MGNNILDYISKRKNSYNYFAYTVLSKYKEVFGLPNSMISSSISDVLIPTVKCVKPNIMIDGKYEQFFTLDYQRNMFYVDLNNYKPYDAKTRKGLVYRLRLRKKNNTNDITKTCILSVLTSGCMWLTYRREIEDDLNIYFTKEYNKTANEFYKSDKENFTKILLEAVSAKASDFIKQNKLALQENFEFSIDEKFIPCSNLTYDINKFVKKEYFNYDKNIINYHNQDKRTNKYYAHKMFSDIVNKIPKMFKTNDVKIFDKSFDNLNDFPNRRLTYYNDIDNTMSYIDFSKIKTLFCNRTFRNKKVSDKVKTCLLNSIVNTIMWNFTPSYHKSETNKYIKENTSSQEQYQNIINNKQAYNRILQSIISKNASEFIMYDNKEYFEKTFDFVIDPSYITKYEVAATLFQ